MTRWRGWTSGNWRYRASRPRRLWLGPRRNCSNSRPGGGGRRPDEIGSAETNLRAVETHVSGVVAIRDRTMTGPGETQIAAAGAQVAAMESLHRVTLIAHDRTIRETKDETRREQGALRTMRRRQGIGPRPRPTA